MKLARPGLQCNAFHWFGGRIGSHLDTRRRDCETMPTTYQVEEMQYCNLINPIFKESSAKRHAKPSQSICKCNSPPLLQPSHRHHHRPHHLHCCPITSTTIASPVNHMTHHRHHNLTNLYKQHTQLASLSQREIQTPLICTQSNQNLPPRLGHHTPALILF